MINPIQVADGVYYIGVNDRRTALFENLWPIPRGVSYNSYFVDDEKTALVETVDSRMSGFLLEKLEERLAGRPLDYIILNHVEPDHSGALHEIVMTHPEATVVGNRKTLKLLGQFYDYDGKCLEVADGDTLGLGRRTFTFFLTPMVHWPETMMTLDLEGGLLFSGDAFGSFGTLDGAIFDDEMDPGFYEDEMRRYYANIVGTYSRQVQKALDRLKGICLKTVCPTHGPVYRKNPEWVIDRYDLWSRNQAEAGVVVVFGSMYGHTEAMADALARYLVEQGVPVVKVFDASKTHLSFLLSEIWKYRGVMLGSCAYNTGMLPPMKALTEKLQGAKLTDRLLGIFGNFSWSGGGVKTLEQFGTDMGWDVIGTAVESQCKLCSCEQIKLEDLAVRMAERLRQREAEDGNG